MRLPPLTTTVVGSYPAALVPGEAVRDHLLGRDPFLAPISAAVEAQIGAGVDVISDGQVRGGMVEVTASGIRGMRMKGRPTVIAELEPKGRDELADAKLALELAGGRAGLKVPVTGPYTMAMSVRDEHYGDTRELAFAFARALSGQVREAAALCGRVQIDEPFFSVEYPEYARELMEALLAGAGARDAVLALHVCGDVSGIYPDLMGMPVDILDHEFRRNPGLLAALEEHGVERQIGYGCVRSDSPEVESVEEILETIARGAEVIGRENMVLDPDCGLRNLPEDAAFRKLENMVLARNRFVEGPE